MFNVNLNWRLWCAAAQWCVTALWCAHVIRCLGNCSSTGFSRWVCPGSCFNGNSNRIKDEEDEMWSYNTEPESYLARVHVGLHVGIKSLIISIFNMTLPIFLCGFKQQVPHAELSDGSVRCRLTFTTDLKPNGLHPLWLCVPILLQEAVGHSLFVVLGELFGIVCTNTKGHVSCIYWRCLFLSDPLHFHCTELSIYFQTVISQLDSHTTVSTCASHPLLYTPLLSLVYMLVYPL